MTPGFGSVETIGEKIRLDGASHLKSLARPEGFEPPTLASEDDFDLQSD